MKKQSHNEVDIVGLITKMQEQLLALDRKVDTLINRSLPPAKPVFQHPVKNPQTPSNGPQNDHHKGRMMHQAICADCKKECEIPFKPSGDRPVYCKECFSRRKMGNTVKFTPDNKPKELQHIQATAAPAIDVSEPPVQKKKKPSGAKKPEGKKKVISKKRK